MWRCWGWLRCLRSAAPGSTPLCRHGCKFVWAEMHVGFLSTVLAISARILDVCFFLFCMPAVEVYSGVPCFNFFSLFWWCGEPGWYFLVIHYLFKKNYSPGMGELKAFGLHLILVFREVSYLWLRWLSFNGKSLNAVQF